MKYAKYLFVCLLLAAVCACKSDPDVKSPDDVLRQQREALALTDGIGVYRNGTSLYLFDKAKHQLSVNPDELCFRIQDDTGKQYVEFVLESMPADAQTPVRLSLKNNVGLNDAVLEDVVLLRSESNGLWLWSDGEHMGFVLPWFEM